MRVILKMATAALLATAIIASTSAAANNSALVPKPKPTPGRERVCMVRCQNKAEPKRCFEQCLRIWR